METDTLRNSVFRRGSRTYFTSSLFFPPDVRREVSTLYADDHMDALRALADLVLAGKLAV